MIPLRDDIPTHSVPVVNYALIVACVIVFLFEFAAPDGGQDIIFGYGMVPARVTGRPVESRLIEDGQPAPPPAIAPWMTLFTCMFLHGGVMHIVGNMLFLYIFGDNVEDHYGHLGYLLMYLGCGLAAGLLHLLSAPGSEVPTVGASGAIAGVMGAYFVMFRHARVMTLIPLGIFTQIVAIPAPFFLGVWFVMQLASATGDSAMTEGVAFWAHVGGFVAGLGGTWLLCRAGLLTVNRPPQYQIPAWQRRQLPWR
ncbi:rhomboid family intramembrane serine protease [bacterium]|nr:rhomboid family intramembrane serine protease [bacterium]